MNIEIGTNKIYKLREPIDTSAKLLVERSRTEGNLIQWN